MRNRMGRPRLKRIIRYNPRINYFKPQGVRMPDLEVVELRHEELEAIRLKYIEGMDQRECAKKMQTSPATLQRILFSANKKIAMALNNGMAIRILNDV